MIVQTLLLLLLLFLRPIHSFSDTSTVRDVDQEIDSTVSFQCEIDQLPFNAVITWVYRPKIHPINGIKWLPLYANGRRLTQNNPRFIVDYSGYNEKTKKYLSILTINQLQPSDEGIYMCKSNQYQSMPLLFNLTITPSMKILPKDGLIELSHPDRSINLSCTVRELSTQRINPLQIKWYHNDHEIASKQLRKKYLFHQNQATLILYIHHLFANDTGVFKCVYDNGKASKDVRIVSTSAVIGYSKSMGRKLVFSWLLLFFSMI